MAYNFQVPLLSMSVSSYFLIPAIVCGFHRSIGNNQLESRTISKGTLGFIQVLENLESPGILFWHFPGLESPGKRPLALESSGNMLKSTKKYEVYERQ